jgi:NAD(P)-dependent dehydrogenase (short-subunit alcohol dehydrogenase family)
LRGLTLSWAKELAIYGITCNEIEPGIPIKTKMSEQVYDISVKNIWIEPEIIAPAYIYSSYPPNDVQRSTGNHYNASEIMQIKQ